MPDDRLIPTRFNELNSSELQERIALIDKLRRRSERQPALVFRGRESIRNDMKDFVSYLREESSSQGFLQVIQGAPGAGKTSLLNQLAVDLDSELVTCIQVESNTLNFPGDLIASFITHTGGSFKETTEAITKRLGGKFGTSGIGLSGEREIKQPSIWERATQFESIWSLLKSSVDLPADRVFVLLVDETQQQRINLTNSFKRIAQQLNAGDTNGIKVLPVFAGLCDTADTLTECGLSRLAHNPIQLSALSQREAEEVVEDTMGLEDTGFDGMFSLDHKQKIAKEMGVASEGWPRHLHTYITAFAEQCAMQLKKDPCQHIDLDAVLDQGHLNRHAYYRSRLAGTTKPMVDALTKWVFTNPEQELITVSVLLDPVAKTGKLRPALEQEIDKVVRAGVLQISDSDAPYGEKQYEIPIPSMRTYLKNGGIASQTLEAFRKTHKEQMVKLVAHV